MVFFLDKIFDISKVKRIKYRDDITFLRAISVLGVVAYHAEIKLIKGGWLGVDIFFVISGYLISNIIISELNENTFNFKKFYIRRIKRIIPGLFSMLILTIPFSYILLTPRAVLEFSESLISSVFFVSNYFFQNLDFYNAEPTKLMPLLHTWSLAIEEQFYILFPIIFYIVFKIFKKYFLFITVNLFLISLFSNSLTNQIIKFYQLPFRAWEIILGVLVMIVSTKFKFKNFQSIGYLVIFFSFFYFDDSMLILNSVEPKILVNIGTVIILFSSKSSNLVPNFFTKLLMYIGLSSYSIYLFHQPIFAFFRIASKKYLLNQGFYLAIIFLIFILSYLNWKYVEVYFQNCTTKKLFLYVLISIFCFLFFHLGSIRSEGYRYRYSYVPDEVLFYSANINIYPENYLNHEFVYNIKDCENFVLNHQYCIWFSETLKDRNIYLVGDSQTNALSVSFLKSLSSTTEKYNLVFFSNLTGRCILSQQSDSIGYVEDCSEEFFNNFIKLIDKEKDIVIAFGRFDTWLTEKGNNEVKCSNCNYKTVFSNRMKLIGENSKAFYVIEPIPTYSYSIADSFLYKKNIWGDEVSINLDLWIKHLKPTKQFINDINLVNSYIIPTIPIFCNSNSTEKCYAVKDNMLLYTDSNHLTLEGANLITDVLNKILISP